MKRNQNFSRLVIAGGALLSSLLLSAVFFTACQNFLQGGPIKGQIQKAIDYSNAKPSSITISSSGSATQTLIPAAGTYQYKPGDTINMSFEPSPGYFFTKWTAFPKDAVSFSDISSNRTAATILLEGGSAEISPAFAKFSPENTSGGVPKNTCVTINFSTPIDTESFSFIAGGSGVSNSNFLSPVFSEDCMTVSLYTNPSDPIPFSREENVKQVSITVSTNDSGGSPMFSSPCTYTYRVNSVQDVTPPLISGCSLFSIYDSDGDGQSDLLQNILDRTDEKSLKKSRTNGKLHVEITAEDDNSGVRGLFVKEIQKAVIDPDSRLNVDEEGWKESPFSQDAVDYLPERFFESETTLRDGKYIISMNFDMLSDTGGFVDLEFSVLDYSGNRSKALTYQLVLDNSVLGNIAVFNRLPQDGNYSAYNINQNVRKICFAHYIKDVVNNQKCSIGDLWYYDDDSETAVCDTLEDFLWKIEWGYSRDCFEHSSGILSYQDLKDSMIRIDAGTEGEYLYRNYDYFCYTIPQEDFFTDKNLYLRVSVTDSAGNTQFVDNLMPRAPKLWQYSYEEEERSLGFDVLTAFKSYDSFDFGDATLDGYESCSYFTLRDFQESVCTSGPVRFGKSLDSSTRGIDVDSQSITLGLLSRACFEHKIINNERNPCRLYGGAEEITLNLTPDSLSDSTKIVSDWKIEAVKINNAGTAKLTINFNSDFAEHFDGAYLEFRDSQSLNTVIESTRESVEIFLPNGKDDYIRIYPIKKYKAQSEPSDVIDIPEELAEGYDNISPDVFTRTETPDIYSRTKLCNNFRNYFFGYVSDSDAGKIEVFYTTKDLPGDLPDSEIEFLDCREYPFIDDDGDKLVSLPVGIFYELGAKVIYVKVSDPNGNYVFLDQKKKFHGTVFSRDIMREFVDDERITLDHVLESEYTYDKYVEKIEDDGTINLMYKRYMYVDSPLDNSFMKAAEPEPADQYSKVVNQFIRLNYVTVESGWNSPPPGEMYYSGPNYVWCGKNFSCSVRELTLSGSKLYITTDNAVFAHTLSSYYDFGDDVNLWEQCGTPTEGSGFLYKPAAEKVSITDVIAGERTIKRYEPSLAEGKYNVSIVYFADGSHLMHKWY